MAKDRLILCEGLCFTIEWGLASNGRCQAKEYYEELDRTERARALALFTRMADVGRIYDTTKFNQETEKLYVFKPQPHRFFCFFLKGRRIFVVTAYQKQGQKAPRREIERAEKIRRYCLALLEQGEKDGKKRST